MNPRWLAIVLCTGLLWAGVIGLARHVYAQDAGNADIDSADESSADAKQSPLDVQGCWGDFSEGGGFIFEFDQNGNGKELESSSTYRLGLGRGKEHRRWWQIERLGKFHGIKIPGPRDLVEWYLRVL